MQRNLRSIVAAVLISFVTASHAEAMPAVTVASASKIAALTTFVGGTAGIFYWIRKAYKAEVKTKALRAALATDSGNTTIKTELEKAIAEEKSLFRKVYIPLAFAGGASLALLAKMASNSWSREHTRALLTLQTSVKREKENTELFLKEPSLESLTGLLGGRRRMDKENPDRATLAPESDQEVAQLRERCAEKEKALIQEKLGEFKEKWNRMCNAAFTCKADDLFELRSLHLQLQMIFEMMPHHQISREDLATLAATKRKLDMLTQLRLTPSDELRRHMNYQDPAVELKTILNTANAELNSDKPLAEIELELEPALWVADLAIQPENRMYAKEPALRDEAKTLLETIKSKLETLRAAAGKKIEHSRNEGQSDAKKP